MPAALLPLASLDQTLLHLVNCRMSAPFWDHVLLTLQDKYVGVPVMLVALGLLFWRDRRAGTRAFLTALLAWAVGMGIATVCWTTINHVRPGRAASIVLKTPQEIATCGDIPDAVVVRTYVSHHPGMPSRHAVTSGAFAVALLLAWRPLGVLGVIYALLVAMARVYSGVHWPSDVLVGLGLGSLLAWGTWRLVPRLLGHVGRRHWVEAPGAVPESAPEAGVDDGAG
jgi:undecaprenyl-diphosphatase